MLLVARLWPPLRTGTGVCDSAPVRAKKIPVVGPKPTSDENVSQSSSTCVSRPVGHPPGKSMYLSS